eukprot:Plantae.Rhodophyta-Rhodochaete_pulchella.ctg4010.p1 GENE.Plantae.Rhodophyta-Rhodochaete_pulchella.ctg4010~~Plantae.Rhodophyta-Rhodochaete_pulchella.ctg4010.p1  ORF type:complete len:861 (+),score=137.05 Plantae.Rhodophyta-Rhodochaete_pulchella.ctg4010:40-2622(+)
MRGRPTLYLPGTDHAGIATQLMVERALAKEDPPLTRNELGRDAFMEKVWDWKREKGGYITTQLRRLGASCDWTRERFTLDEGICNAVNEAFVRLHEKGLVYRGEYMVNWSPSLQTAVSDLEVESVEEEGKMYYFKYPIADDPGSFIPVATTRPETILGDTAVCVHPEDTRYSHLIGKEVEVPFTGRRAPVIADEYVEREFGTGALKITPGHDYNDYEIGKRHDLPIVTIMDKVARISLPPSDKSESKGLFDGLDRFECRLKIWEEMEARGMSIKVAPHTLRVPRSQRGGEVVEPLVSNQWFIKTKTLADKALAAVKSGETRILPERFGKIYFGWLDNIHDWCVSRQLWWGHRIPVWYVSGSGETSEYIVALDDEDARRKLTEKYGAEKAVHMTLTQEDDVLDTWFSSGLWPFATMGWPDIASEDVKNFYPNTVLETGYDIIFFWVARMMMLGIELTGKAPFSVIYLHGLVRDSQGQKMSKTKGNVIDPLEVIGTLGTDALRYTLVTGVTPGQDVPLSLEKIEANRNFANKLWNAGRYIWGNLSSLPASQLENLQSMRTTKSFGIDVSTLRLPERYIISRCHQLVDEVSDGLESYNFGEPGSLIYEFLWDEFADWYIEASKTRLYGGDETSKSNALKTLVYVLDTCLRLLHPYMPFVTEAIWQRIPHDAVSEPALIVSSWPQAKAIVDMDAIRKFNRLQMLVRAIRNARAEYQVEPGRRIGAIIVCDNGNTLDYLTSESGIICSLAKVEESNLICGLKAEVDIPEGDSAIHLIVSDDLEVHLPMAGLIDYEKEKSRLEKQLARAEKDLEGLNRRLQSPGFARAPAKVIEETKCGALELEDKVSALRKRLVEVSEMSMKEVS